MKAMVAGGTGGDVWVPVAAPGYRLACVQAHASTLRGTGHACACEQA